MNPVLNLIRTRVAGAAIGNRIVFLMFLLAAGLLVTLAVGFNQNHMVHETFHDIRHAMGFPCH